MFGGPDADEDTEEAVATPTRQFSLLEITSGLPDDSREADERAVKGRLRDLRGRVKAARAAISGTPGAEEVLRRDWVKAARFYASFGITEGQFRHGVRDTPEKEADNMMEQSPLRVRGVDQPELEGMIATGESAEVFDLASISVRDYRAGSRNVRILFTVLLAALLATAVAVIASTPGFFSNLYSVSMTSFILVGFGGLSILAILTFSPGAIRLEVASSGTRLTYANGRTKEYRWDSRGTRMTLWLNPASLPGGRPYPFAIHEIRTVCPWDNSLTPEAFDAVLSSARNAGLEIQSSPQSGRRSRPILRIRTKTPP